jgi:sulfur carrier protein ThiS adenylyltransferase
VQVETHTVKLTPENIPQIFKGVDVMVEAFDRADQKAMLMNTFCSCTPETPFVGASGMAGYASGETIGIRSVSEHIYIVGDLETGAQPGCGLMAPRVGIAASMQANLALRLLVDGRA